MLFLPTLEQTGLGVRVNADFSTDPSRTRVVFDDFTNECIANAADAIAKLFIEAIQKNPIDSETALCLAPTIGLATLAFQKRTLRTELIQCVRDRLSFLKDDFVLLPQWLNANDAGCIAKSIGKSMLLVGESRDGGLLLFLRYLGIQALSIDAVLKVAQEKLFSEMGCVETVAFSVSNVITGDNVKSAAKARIWVGKDEPQSLATLAQNGIALADRFIQQLNAAGVTTADLARFVRLSAGEAVEMLIPRVTTALLKSLPSGNTPAADQLATGELATAYDPLLLGATASPSGPFTQKPEFETKFMPAWRGAEQYVAQILKSYGYAVEDRSRQNLGYDIYAEKDSRKHYIEVKLLDYTGQPFVLTPNEEAVAREYGESYSLALILRGKEGVHIQFVNDPVTRLKFVRQCRQWVWECSDYEFISQFIGNDAMENGEL